MPYSFDRLAAYLENLPDESEAMNLEELDGFLAAVLACPDLIPPGQWLPHIWSRNSGSALGADFGDLDDANKALGLIMEHYNEIARCLLPGSKSPYEPIISVRDATGEEFCLLWLMGFDRALKAWPESWMKIPISNDKEAIAALARLRRYIATCNAEELDDTALALLMEAPEHLAESVETLSLWRFTQIPLSPISAQQSFKNTGRNDQCPCGSGRKYKKCHGAN